MSVTVGERMSRQLATVARDASLRDAAQRMVERHVGSLLVFAEEQLVGILTERDVLKAVAAGRVETPVSDWMTASPETIEPGDTLEHAAVVMVHGGFRHLPVAEGDDVVGIVSMRDVMKHVAGDVAAPGF